MIRTQLTGKLKPWTIRILTVLAIALTLLVAFIIFIYANSPSAVRHPRLDHFHFRMQILVNGAPENFADAKYQSDYIKDSCSEELPEKPIHFHDAKDQMVHVHWKDITGGLVLKNYGWNLAGGSDRSLGYRFDTLLAVRQVSIHGLALPRLSSDVNFYVFSGDEKNYQERNIEDFKTQSLEDFFGKSSSYASQDNPIPLISDLLPATAHAHSGHAHGEEGSADELARVNNLLGNVVIFAQKDKPSPDTVKQRFSVLEPLAKSTCGG